MASWFGGSSGPVSLKASLVPGGEIRKLKIDAPGRATLAVVLNTLAERCGARMPSLSPALAVELGVSRPAAGPAH